MTDTTREAFEVEATLYDLDLNRFKEGYSDCNTDYGWLFWQAATLAAQDKRKPLTDKQIEQCVERVWGSFTEFDEVRLFTRGIESAHGIKQ